jgi:hypothetical protein
MTTMNDFVKSIKEVFGKEIAYRVKAKDGRIFKSNNWDSAVKRLNIKRRDK